MLLASGYNECFRVFFLNALIFNTNNHRTWVPDVYDILYSDYDTS